MEKSVKGKRFLNKKVKAKKFDLLYYLNFPRKGSRRLSKFNLKANFFTVDTIDF